MDSITKRVEEEWQAGRRPRIEEFLADTPEPLKTNLLGELLRIDLEYRARHGETPTAADYRSRFPQHVALIEQVMERHEVRGELSTTRDFKRVDTSSVRGSHGDPSAVTQPQKLGRFEVIEPLGQGAFGTVYRARDPKLDRDVALKIPRAGALADDDDVQRFFREARSAAQLRHPNIVSIHDAGETAGTYFIASDFVPGCTLRQRLNEAWQPTLKEAVKIIQKLAVALHLAHNKGIIHRDVKPANVMLDPTGEPLLTDFGLARREETDVLRTQAGERMGTPAYMSPEQAGGHSHLADSRSDLWSLGVMLYELLCGRRPFEGNLTDVIAAILEKEPDPLRKQNRAIPIDLETICLKCLAKRPEDRYPSCQHLADELDRWLHDQPIQARPIGIAERGVRWCRRHPVRAAVVAVVCSAVIGALAYRQTRPAYLDLRVVPANAQVALAGQPVALHGGRAVVASRPGRWDLQVTANGFLPEQQQVVLVRGKENTVVMQIELRSRYGHIHLESVPDGAVVAVLGAGGAATVRGTTPFYSPQLPTGEYTVQVHKSMYQPAEFEVRVPDGDRVADLKPIQLVATVEGVGRIHQLRQIGHRLEQPIDPPWQLTRTPLTDVLEHIERTENIRIQWHAQLFDDVRIDRSTRVDLSAHDISLEEGLQRLLSEYGLTFVPVGNGDPLRLRLTTVEQAKRNLEVVVHSVVELLPPEPSDRFDYDMLIENVTSTIAPISWIDAGGDASIRVTPDGKALSVRQSWQNQLEIDRLLAEIGQTATPPAQPVAATKPRDANEPAPPDTVDNRLITPGTTPFDGSYRRLLEIKERLQQPVSRKDPIRNTPFSVVVTQLGERHGLDIGLDEAALQADGIALDGPVDLTIEEGESVLSVLKKLLAPWKLRLGAGGKVGREKLIITTGRGIHMRCHVVAYPVHELVPPRGNTAPVLKTISEAITQDIRPESWSSVGGPATIFPFPGSNTLIVRQSFGVHLELVGYLEQWRRQKSRPGVSEVVQDVPAVLRPRAAVPPAERDREFGNLAGEVERAVADDMSVDEAADLRQRATRFIRIYAMTPEALSMAKVMSRLPWPVDELSVASIAPDVLLAARGGEAGDAPEGLVAILGEGRFRHWDAVRAIAAQPDGTVVSASDDGTLRIWEATSGRLQRTVYLPDAVCGCPTFDPAGKVLAFVKNGGPITLWDVESEEPRHLLQGHLGEVHAIAFDAEGKTLASGGKDLTIRLWDASTGEELRSLTGHRNRVVTVSFGADGRLLASVDEDGALYIWDAESGQPEEIDALTDEVGKATSAEFSSQGQVLAVMGADARIHVWDHQSRTLRASRQLDKGFQSQPGVITCSHDGQAIGVITGQDTFQVLETDRLLTRLRDRGVTAAAFQPQRRQLVLGGRTGTMAVWDRSQRKLIAGSLRDVGVVQMLAFNFHGDKLATADHGYHGNRVWDLATRASQPAMKSPKESVCFGVDGRQLFLGASRSLVVKDLVNGKSRPLLGTGAYGTDRELAHHALFGGRPFRLPTVALPNVRLGSSMDMSLDGRVVAHADVNTTVTLFEARTGREIHRHKHQKYVSALALRPDGQVLALGGYPDTISFFDILTGQLLDGVAAPDHQIAALDYSPNGRTLVSGGADGTVRLWDTVARRAEHTFDTAAAVTSVAFSPDGQKVASSHVDGVVRIWNPSKGQPLRTLRVGPPRGIIHDVEFSPESRHVATANNDGTVYMFRIDEG